MANIVFNIPDEDAEGYLILMESVADFQEKLKKDGFTAEVIRAMVVFVASYIEGETLEERIELARRMSKKQFDEVFRAISGGGTETIPPA